MAVSRRETGPRRVPAAADGPKEATMSTAQPSLRPALLAGAAVAVGLAGVTAGGAQLARAQGRGVLPVVNRHAALSWGLGRIGQLGHGTAAGKALPRAIRDLWD